MAVVVEAGDFTVDDGALDGQIGEGGGQATELFEQVTAAETWTAVAVLDER